MTGASIQNREVLRMPSGRYIWSPPLQLVGFIPKGKQRATKEFVLSYVDNCFYGALAAAIKAEGGKVGPR